MTYSSIDVLVEEERTVKSPFPVKKTINQLLIMMLYS